MFKTFRSLALLSLAALTLTTVSLDAQTALTQTTLSSAITSSQTQNIKLASVSGITAGSTFLYIDQELLSVTAVSSPFVNVAPRGSYGTKAFGHVSGAGVIVGPAAAFIDYDPVGACTAGNGVFAYSPVVNVVSGTQWLCSLIGKATPGFVNSTGFAPLATTAVASASTIVPSGPLFHVTGTTAIVNITVPVGFDPKGGGSFTIFADAVFSWTAAGNIAVASGTVVANRSYTFTYDANNSKFYPSTN